MPAPQAAEPSWSHGPGGLSLLVSHPARPLHLSSRGLKCCSGNQVVGPQAGSPLRRQHHSCHHISKKESFLKTCAREIWLHCATWDVTLVVEHVSGESLTLTADALSRYHLGQVYRERVDVILKDWGITRVPVPQAVFTLSHDLQHMFQTYL